MAAHGPGVASPELAGSPQRGLSVPGTGPGELSRPGRQPRQAELAAGPGPDSQGLPPDPAPLATRHRLPGPRRPPLAAPALVERRFPPPWLGGRELGS